MLTFKWSARDWSGDWRNGETEAASAANLKARLCAEGLLTISIHPQQPPQKYTQRRITATDRLRLTQQLSHLLSAGLPLTDALALIKARHCPIPVAQCLSMLHTDLLGGYAFSECIRRQQYQFSPLYFGIVAASEESGQLAVGLAHLSRQLASDAHRQAQIRAALRYPITIAIVAVTVISLIMIWVIPGFEAQFAQRGTPLPWLTQQLIRSASGLADWGAWLILLATVTAVFLKHQIRRPLVRRSYERVLFFVPWFGHWLRLVYSAALAETLSSLLKAGLPLTQALSHLRQAQASLRFQAIIDNVNRAVSNGKPISEAFAAHPDIAPLLAQLCVVGEATGQLDQFLDNAAITLNVEATTALEKWTAAIEPLSIVLLGSIIGTIVLAMYWPVFQIGQTI